MSYKELGISIIQNDTEIKDMRRNAKPSFTIYATVHDKSGIVQDRTFENMESIGEVKNQVDRIFDQWRRTRDI